MMKSQFVSNYLTHWTGKDNEGFERLKSILLRNQLWLNKCVHYRPSAWHEANLKMVCFTDIPHYLSKEHCGIYGNFGIAFKKSSLIHYGANPVLYLTDIKKDDASKVYTYICDANTGKIHLDPDVLDSLKRIFGFVQDYQHENYAYYYEREWRILKNNLRDFSGDRVMPGCCGSFLRDKGELQYYIQFAPEDVAFLICPKAYFKRVTEVDSAHPISAYEYLVL